MHLTDEQDRVAGSSAKNLVVNALAGTGKTTTLVEYSRRRPREPMMYVAFNRSIKEEAKKKFPRNVRCVTTHGLAYPTFGTMYAKKLGNPKAYHVSNALGLDILSAGRVLEVVTSYLISTDRDITEDHALAIKSIQNPNAAHQLARYARDVWELMKNTNNTAIPMPHDGYLKLYQLSNPVINTGIILFDECQDANPVTLSFISKQKANKVFVGDHYQSIYGFRGAVDALNSIKADERLLLSSSFRFGAGIANLASELLAEWRGCGTPLNGLGQYGSVFHVDRNCPHAVLSRTNGGLFGEAVVLLTQNKPFGFVGGVEGARFDQILDTYHLMCGMRGSVRDQFIASLEDFAQMKLYGEVLDDKEVKALVKVVEEYTHDIPGLIEEITNRAVPKLVGREVALSTTHKAKGMEWKNVVLVDDYVDLEVKIDDKGKPKRPEPEEINILYVALTRAIKGLQVPPKVHDWLARKGRTALLKSADDTSEAVASVQMQGIGEPHENGGEEDPDVDNEMSRWFSEMREYFNEMRVRFQEMPEQASAVAAFLGEEREKFNEIAEKEGDTNDR